MHTKEAQGERIAMVAKSVGEGTSQIERQAVTSDISQVASYLQQHLGQKVTAYLSGINDSKLVGQWAAGRVQPRPAPTHRLRTAYQAARYLVDAYDNETAQAWFFGTNSKLGGRAPAFALREGEDPGVWSSVVSVAKAFVETKPSRPKEEIGASAMASYLLEHLGADLTSYLTGVDEVTRVEQWAEGALVPEPLAFGRLRAGYEAAREIAYAFGDETAQSWFSGMNPSLDDEAPGYVLRHSSDATVWKSVVEAAEELVEFDR
ncbi:MAG TPA: hypothetical protein VGS07_26310 [Thermoanaerobaculia bacterium]|jgi:hypothetical protein|nr:hypothetical protein [Thermoanaerobaculia bacterium]